VGSEAITFQDLLSGNLQIEILAVDEETPALRAAEIGDREKLLQVGQAPIPFPAERQSLTGPFGVVE